MFSLQASEMDNTSMDTTSMNANPIFRQGEVVQRKRTTSMRERTTFNVVLFSVVVLPSIDSTAAISLDAQSMLISKEVVPARRQPQVCLLTEVPQALR